MGVLGQLHHNEEEGGYRVLADDIPELGYEVSERRVWRVCKVAGIRAAIVARKTRYRSAGDLVGDDLILRDFTAEYLVEKWRVDITENWTTRIPANEGKFCTSAFTEVCSRRIVGYAIDLPMKASLAVRALQNALINRGHPRGVIVHTDRGGQFRSTSFQHALRVNGLRGSMRRVGARGDNAAMESLFSLVKKNVLDRQSWATREHLRLAIVSWIEGECYRKRRRRVPGSLTPIEFETIMRTTASLATGLAASVAIFGLSLPGTVETNGNPGAQRIGVCHDAQSIPYA
jgi:transposase InsO family protein